MGGLPSDSVDCLVDDVDKQREDQARVPAGLCRQPSGLHQPVGGFAGAGFGSKPLLGLSNLTGAVRGHPSQLGGGQVG